MYSSIVLGVTAKFVYIKTKAKKMYRNLPN